MLTWDQDVEATTSTFFSLATSSSSTWRVTEFFPSFWKIPDSRTLPGGTFPKRPLQRCARAVKPDAQTTPTGSIWGGEAATPLQGWLSPTILTIWAAWVEQEWLVNPVCSAPTQQDRDMLNLLHLRQHLQTQRGQSTFYQPSAMANEMTSSAKNRQKIWSYNDQNWKCYLAWMSLKILSIKDQPWNPLEMGPTSHSSCTGTKMVHSRDPNTTYS